jgi:hypothetical protein
MTRIIRLPVGFRVSKAGKVVRCTKQYRRVGAPSAAGVKAYQGRAGKDESRARGCGMREQFITKRFHAKSVELIEQANTIIEVYQARGFVLTLRADNPRKRPPIYERWDKWRKRPSRFRQQ